MEKTQIKQELTSYLQRFPKNHQVLSFAVEELLNKLHGASRLSQLLSSKMTVRQVTLALSWLLERDIIVPLASGTHTIDGVPEIDDVPRNSSEARSDQDLVSFCLSSQVKENYPRPYTLGQHLIDDHSVAENPLYRKIATALLKEKKSEYDQSIETPESQVRRYKLMKALGDTEHGSLLLLGDDALFSLFLATHGVTSEIYVADIDKDLLSFIRNTAEQYQLANIHVIEYNIFDELPEQFKEAFDCFAVNGFKDLGGLLTFISRGLQSLKKPVNFRSGYFNFGSPDISDEKLYKMEFEIQKYLTRVGVTLEHIVPAPESYVPPEFEIRLMSVIRGISLETDFEQKIMLCESEFGCLKEEFGSTSWVLIENFPDIHLSPLRIAQLRVNQFNETEVSRFLRLSKMFSS